MGAARLPPGWHQLSALQRLRVVNGGQGSYSFAAGSGRIHGNGGEWSKDEWGTAPLIALTARTCLEVVGEQWALWGATISQTLCDGASLAASCPLQACMPSHFPALLPRLVPTAAAGAAQVATVPCLEEMWAIGSTQPSMPELGQLRPDVSITWQRSCCCYRWFSTQSCGCDDATQLKVTLACPPQ